MNAFSVKPLLLKMKSNLSSTGFSPSLSNGLCALHAAVQGLRKLHFWLKVSLKLHIYFLTLLTAAVVSKWIHLQFTIYMPFFSAVQRSFLFAIPSASPPKKLSKALPKSNEKPWVYKIHCAHIFFRRASSEQWSFLFFILKARIPILDCWILRRVNFDWMYRLTIRGLCAKVIASATLTQFILLI